MAASHKYNIYLYAPNLIGYIRVLFSLIGCLYLYESPVIFTWLYVISFLLDAVDGHVARMLNQTSRLGAVLDMVTDRFSTAALVTLLANFFPQYLAGWIFLNVLDFVSHWMLNILNFFSSSLVIGESSHKNVNPNHPRLLQIYYNNRNFMATLCVGNEIFYVVLYWMRFVQWSSSTIWIVFGILTPLWALKQLLNLIQMISAANDIVDWEWEHEHKNRK